MTTPIEPEREAPKRLRAADVIDNLQATIAQLTTRSPGRADVAVEFTRNAKGETQIATKIGAPQGTDADELAALAAGVLAVAQTTYEAACAKYPTGTGHVRNEGQDQAPVPKK